MSNWNFLKIKQIGTVITGKTPSKNAPSEWGEDYNFVTPSDYRNYFKYARTSSRKLSELGFNSHKKRLIPKNSILVTCIGSDMGKTVLNSSHCFTNQQINALIPNNSLIDYDFIYYLFKNNEAVFKSLGSDGTAVPILNKSDFENIEFLIPGLPEQKAIASVLSSLDDKIDLLHRQNKTLESMAETLFRQRFIEECDNKWPLVLLGDFISCINGASYKSSELLKSQKALVTLKNFARDGSFRKDGFKEYVGHYKLNQVVVDKDIVVAHTDLTQDASLIGNPIYVRNIIGYDTLVISMDLVKVELNSELLSKDFLFYLLKSSEFKDYALSCSNGSSVIHLSKKALPNYTFNLPPYERIASFSVIAESYYEKMSINTKSIQTLETLRDTLLPKLMSGEVRVKYAEELIASVA
ncbi:restriction endonuclease subunit S [Enterobacter vonholyi]|uniref:restriction endonuclease subunit S n=1 Tax=Enterobacter vonholyi TaxID=2797505 RepID=UPI00331C0240